MKKKSFQEQQEERKKIADELQIPEQFVIHMRDKPYVLVKGQVLFALRLGMQSLVPEILESDHSNGFYLMRATLTREDGGVFVAHATGCGSIMKGGHRMAHAETRAISRAIRSAYPLNYTSPEEHDLTNEMLNANAPKDPTTERACSTAMAELIDVMDSKYICSTTLQTVCKYIFNKESIADLSTGQMEALLQKFKDGPSEEDTTFYNNLSMNAQPTNPQDAIAIFNTELHRLNRKPPWMAVYLQRYINRL
tara:strand:- start:161 stop:913 length:753 start_codon:yes stop_codon:yes gene_type:complete